MLLIIFRQPGANIIETVDRVTALLPQLQALDPAGDRPRRSSLDRTTTIRASVHDVERTLVISIALVILVVFLFLRNARATLIPSVAVPLSLIGTFGVMYLLGYSLDNLSLMALTISTGFVVDDAIVVIENITRHLEQGMTPLRGGAARARSEIGFTVLSISISLVAVFIPILLMGGIVGRLFREFAVTLAVAIARLAGRLADHDADDVRAAAARPSTSERHGRLYRAERARLRLAARAATSARLRWVLRHPRADAAGDAGDRSALNVYLYVDRPQGLLPAAGHRAGSSGSIQADQDISFQAMQQQADASSSTIVSSDPGGRERRRASPAAAGDRRNTGAHVHRAEAARRAQGLAPTRSSPGCAASSRACRAPTLFLQAVQDMRVGGRQSNAQYQYTLQGDDLDELNALGAAHARQRCARCPSSRDVNSDQQNRGPAGVARHRPRHRRRASASRPQAIDDTLYDAFGQRQVSTMYTPLNQYHVVMEVDAAVLAEPRRRCDDIYVRSADGSAGAAQRVRRATRRRNTPLAVNHQGQFPAVTLSFNLAPGVALGDAVDAIDGARARDRAARRASTAASGHRAGVPGLAGQPAAADPGRAARPSTSCSACSTRATSTRSRSSRRCRRPASARCWRCCCSARDLERHRADRHHPADRHREEERDHDDRLRARGRARRGHEPARGDLRGLPAALPADHDDHDGRAARRAAAGARPAPAPSCAGRSASPSSAA